MFQEGSVQLGQMLLIGQVQRGLKISLWIWNMEVTGEFHKSSFGGIVGMKV